MKQRPKTLRYNIGASVLTSPLAAAAAALPSRDTAAGILMKKSDRKLARRSEADCKLIH